MKHLSCTDSYLRSAFGAGHGARQKSRQRPPAQPRTEAPVDVNAAIKTITEFTADEKKVAGYCAISKEIAAVKDGDDAKMEELGKKMDAYLSGLGQQYVDAFAATDPSRPESEDGKKLDAALGALETKCGA